MHSGQIRTNCSAGIDCDILRLTDVLSILQQKTPVVSLSVLNFYRNNEINSFFLYESQIYNSYKTIIVTETFLL